VTAFGVSSPKKGSKEERKKGGKEQKGKDRKTDRKTAIGPEFDLLRIALLW